MDSSDWRRWYDDGDFTNDWFSKRIAGWLPILEPRRDAVNDVLEIGSWEGRSAIFFLNYFSKARLTCVDTFAGSPNHQADPQRYAEVISGLEARFDRNTAPMAHRIEKIKQRSAAALDQLADAGRSFDVVFIDASHRRQDVLTDSILAWPLVRLGGFLIWDDLVFGEGLPETERPRGAINMFCAMFEGCFTTLKRDADLIVVKRAAWPEKFAD